MNRLQSIGMSHLFIGLALTNHVDGWFLGMILIGAGSGIFIASSHKGR